MMGDYQFCNEMFCEICRSREAGRPFRYIPALQIEESRRTLDYPCPRGYPWHERPVTILDTAPRPETVTFSGPLLSRNERKSDSAADVQSAKSVPTADVQMVKRRFGICKSCEHTLEQGHGCALRKGCCFGAWRARPESRCPADPAKW